MKERIEKSNVQEIFELNMIQKGMLYHYFKEDQGNLYNVRLTFNIEGDLNVDTLREAFGIVQSNNEVLRSVFRWEEVEKPVQIILKNHPIDFPFHDITEHDSKSIELLEGKFLKMDQDDRFDLTTLPIKIRLIKTGQELYVLNITNHHILYDGWSTGILLKELFQCYDQLRNNDEPRFVQKPSLKYVLQAIHEKSDLSKGAVYWKNYLKGHEITPLFPKNQIDSGNRRQIQRLGFIVPDAEIEVFARKNKLTKASIIYSAYGILVQKYNNISDVVFGTTVSSRDAGVKGHENIIGNFINTLPLRITDFEEQSLLELVRGIHKDLTERNQFSSTSYFEIKKLLGLTPLDDLFDSVIVIENYPIDEQSINSSDEFNIKLRSVYENTGIPLVITVFFREILEIEVAYKTNLISDEYANDICNNFIVIIKEILSAGDEKVRSINLLSEREEHQLLYGFNDTKADYPKEETVLSLFEKQVEKTPDNIALLYEGTSMTYKKLNENAEKIATYLRAKAGIKEDHLVGVMLEIEEYLLPSILGILKAGAAYVPIDAGYPAKRVNSIVKDSKIKALITRNKFRNAAVNDLPTLIDLDEALSDISACKLGRNEIKISRDQLVYSIYTSGSSGRPKGVMIEHGSLVNYVLWAAKTYIKQAPAVFPLYTSISFDLTATSIFVPLITGNSIKIYEEEKDLIIRKIIMDDQANVVKLTPSHLKAIRDSELSGLSSMGNTKTLIVGGEELETRLAKDIYDQFDGNIEIYNEYGPTETTVGCMIHKYDPENSTSSVPIGMPIDNIQIYLLDKFLKPVATNVNGELYVSGEGLARGYVSNEDLTSQRFIDNPFIEGQRMYKTGDVARRLDDGKIIFKGRADNQLKIRGFRIELGEIENQISRHEQIKELVVIMREKQEDKYLVAYYVSQEEIDIVGLKASLAESLPSYMLPAYFVRLAAIPLNSNGKLDRKLLPEPKLSVDANYIPATGEIQEKIQEIWSEVLGHEKISTDRNFFDIGGDSLKLINVSNRLKKAFNQEVRITDMFNHPTIFSLANFFNKKRGMVKKNGIAKSNVQEIFEMSMVQKGMLYHYLKETKENLYNVQISFKIEGNLDVDLFKEAFHIVQSKNEVLRSAFRWEEVAAPIQITLKECPVDFIYHDISQNKTPSPSDFVDQYLVDDRHTRFDLTRLALRVSIIRASENAYIVILTHHHILYDGWSTGILLKELFYSYGQLQAGKKPVISSKPDYREVRLSLKKNGHDPKSTSYWETYLKGYEQTTFTFENSGNSKDKEVEKFRRINPGTKIENFAHSNKITTASVIYLAYGILLQKYNDTSDVIFGTTVSDRNHSISGLDQIIGNFINSVPLRIKGLEGNSLREAAKMVNNDLIQRNQFHHSSLYEINKIIELKSGEALFDTTIGIGNYPLDKDMVNSVRGLDIELNTVYENTNAGLAIAVFFGDDLEIEFNYKKALLNSTFIESLATHFINILEQIVEFPDKKVESLEILSSQERDLMLNGFNATKVDYPKKTTIIELFEKQLTKTPDSCALVYQGTKISYSELDKRTNELASIISTKGIGEEIVAIYVAPSIDMVIGILAILKAGLAFLPLDVYQHSKRQEKILNDSKTKLLLTQESRKNELSFSGEKISIDGEAKPSLANDHISQSRDEGLIYTIYTSGSTGRPKGVKIGNRNLLNYISWFNEASNLKAQDKLLLSGSYAFDAIYTQFFSSLLTGAELHIIDRETYLSPPKLLRYINDMGITFLKMTPTLFNALIKDTNFNENSFERVRLIMLGGEAISVKDVAKIASTHKHIDIINHYGPTETTIGSVAKRINQQSIDRFIEKPTIGKPIFNTKAYILNKRGGILPIGCKGELYISGDGVGMGYLGEQELTKQKFLENPYASGEKMYKTGDLARWLPEGDIEYLGRIDQQVKIRGHRIELGEIEHQLVSHKQIKEGAVVVKKFGENKSALVAYYVTDIEILSDELRGYLFERLPDYMIPSYYVALDQLPVTLNGKMDRRSLPDPEVRQSGNIIGAANKIEEVLVGIWKKVLDQDQIGTNNNFFEIGGDSITLISVNSLIIQKLECEIQMTDLFEHPTIKDLAQFISSKIDNQSNDPEKEPKPAKTSKGNVDKISHSPSSDIAIIGMAGRFPGAKNVNEFWENLKSGTDSITREIEKDSADPIIKAKGILEECELFEASFFNYTPEEADLMDPQMRIFHECVWGALEDAGYNSFEYEGAIGLYAGASPNPYYSPRPGRDNHENWMDQWQSHIYSNQDYLCPRVSYKLNLRGPSVNISTACSTALVAIDAACNDLLSNKCDIAVSGGISLTFHDNGGYRYKKNMILSPDGYCRAFDKNAAGTVGGNGVGIVVLKKLKDALRDGDNIHAVIKGSATNNDGIQKVGFTAPSVVGQAEVIKSAIKKAKIRPETISYVETHGTGTLLGDPIEMEGLRRAFNSHKENFCAIGSVKTNVGHLNAAAGVTGLIKTVLSLKNKQIPPSLHFESPNEALGIEQSPFYLNHKLKDWDRNGHPRRAGVSSFGIGGTNAHLIVEEAPQETAPSESGDYQLMMLTAKTEAALDRNIKNLKLYMETNESENLSDIVYTQNVGRALFNYRKALVFGNKKEAIDLLSTKKKEGFVTAKHSEGQVIAFMFSGQGSQYPNMLHDLYQSEGIFRNEVNKCFEIVRQKFGKDLKAVVFTKNKQESDKINHTEFTQPLLFIMEYALARLLMSWGIQPDLMIGHSIGEYAAACIGGVISLDDALMLVTKRGELMQKLPVGSMLSIAISEEKLEAILLEHIDISLATVNSSESCVVSGADEPIERFRKRMEEDGYQCRPVQCSHAFHSHMMNDILDDFEEVVKTIKINPQKIPLISNLSGELADDKEIMNPKYWVNHLRQTVRFSKGVGSILTNKKVVFIEIGPGNVLSSFVRSNKQREKGHDIVNMGRHPKVQENDLKYLLTALGKLYMAGLEPNWKAFYKLEKRKRVSLPTYSFEKTKYPLKTESSSEANTPSETPLARINDISKWFYVPTWKISPTVPIGTNTNANNCYLLLADDHGVSKKLEKKFSQEDEQIIYVRKGESFKQEAPTLFQLDPTSEADFDKLFALLSQHGLKPNRIIHAWGIGGKREKRIIGKNLLKACTNDQYSLIYLVRAAHQYTGTQGKQITLLTSDLQNIQTTRETSLAKTPSVGLLKVISQEYPAIKTTHIDISLSECSKEYFGKQLYQEIKREETGKTVALRNSMKWMQIFDRIEGLKVTENRERKIREKGVYFITGGLGELGFSLSRYLLKHFNAKVVLVGRTVLPPPEDRDLNLHSLNGNTEMIKKIKRIQDLEKERGEVLYFSGNVSERKELVNIIKKTEKKYGPINGVIHAAGILGSKSKTPISNLEKEQFEEHFTSKIMGLHRLKEVLGERQLDFCIVTSSLSTILGGLGFGSYVAANTYMDYLINSYCEESKPNNWTSVNFDGLNLDDGTGQGIDPKEIEEVFEQILSLISLPQIVVSLGDLNKRLERWVYRKPRLSEQNNTSHRSQNDKSAETVLSLEKESVSSLEKTVIKMWQEFFGNPEIDEEDDFFELGGDSLKALTIIGRIHKKFNIELSVADFFTNPTIKELCLHLSGLGGENNSSRSSEPKFSPIPQSDKKAYYPLSSVQKRLYFLYEFDGLSIAYNMPLMLKLEGDLDRQKLTAVFVKLMERHESLRTSFEITGKEPQARILEQFRFEMEYYEGNGNEERLKKEFIRPFDLSSGPIIRVGLIEVSSTEHILMVDLHHIISDGVSKSVLMKDFMALYRQEELSALPLQYKDYAEWQQEDAHDRKIAGQKEFWINEFAEEVQTLELPTDYPRPLILNNEGSIARFELNREETAKLKSMTEKQGGTLFMVLLSVYKVLLSKLSNQEDIVIGTPIAGRSHPDLEQIVGMFVNTLPVRSNLDGNLGFSEFLSRLQSKTLACLDNQDYQYEDLLDELRIERDTSRNPLFDVMFSFENFEKTKLDIPGLQLTLIKEDTSVSKFDLILNAYEDQGQIFLEFEYSTELFKEETIRKFISYFKNIITAVVSNPTIKISSIEIITTEEKNQILKQYNDTETDYPKNQTVLGLFEKQAGQVPDKTVVAMNDLKLSYADLDSRANQLAHFINKVTSLKSNDFVLLYMNKSVDTLAAVLAIWKAGGAYVPVDVTVPEERLSHIINDIQPKLVFTDGSLLPTLLRVLEKENAQVPALFFKGVDSGEDESEELPSLYSESIIKGFSKEKLPVHPSGSDIAYAIYTSGSTGLSKAVAVCHNTYTNAAFAWRDEYHLNTIPVNILQMANYSFDVFAGDIARALVNGGKLVLCPDEIRLEFDKLTELISGHKISLFESTPSLIIPLMDYIHENDVNTSSLNLLIIGSDVCKFDDFKKITKRFGPTARVINSYGLTEATIDSSYYEETYDNMPDSGIVPIGKPLPNMRFYILDKGMNLQPVGLKGELFVAGDGVSRGYLNREELTAERFVSDPYYPGKKMYKTGDLARWLPDGNVEFFGRIDDQVKIRGMRIEIGEIEFHLNNHVQINRTVVLVKEKEEHKFLVVYYVSENQLEPTDLRDYLSGKLPDYMIPSYYVHLDRLPLSVNGKLDRKALPEPEIKISDDYIGPKTNEEQMLVEVWTQILGVEKIGVTDNFFSVGGDSIKSIQISSKVRSLGYELAVREIFAYPTIRQLSTKLKVLVSMSDQSTVEGRSPLSPIQRWLFESGIKNKNHYNQPVLLNFPEGLSAQDTQTIFGKLQSHHDALRMVISRDGDDLFQVNRATGLDIPLEERDLREEIDPKTALLSEANKIQTSIDLISGPLIKLGLFHMADGSRLLIVIHHLVVDGVSWRILVEDVESLYQQVTGNEQLSLPAKTDSFLSWSSKLQEYMQSSTFLKARDYWDDFHNQDIIPIERDYPKGESQLKYSKVIALQLTEEETTQLLTSVHSAFNTQINDILLAALFMGIKKQYGHSAIVIDLEGHGREPIKQGIDMSRTVGWFASIYPVLLRCGENNLSDIIKQVKEVLRSVPNRGIDYMAYKYMDSQEIKNEIRSQIGFNYFGQFDADTKEASFSQASENFGFNQSQNDPMDYDWGVSGIIREGRLEMTLTYGTKQYKEETINALMGHYKQSLRELVDYCTHYSKKELTPSDLTYKGLSIVQLDELQKKYDIEDIYPLSPMQQGMLFHSLMDSDSAHYFEQLTCDLRGDLDIDAVEESMNALLDRHSILRTVFLHEGYERSIQVVLKERKLDFTYKDLRKECLTTSREELLREYGEKDLARKFDLATDVLIRLIVLRTADDFYTFIWSHHHVLMDGWCMGIIFSGFKEAYSVIKNGEKASLSPENPYSNYISWLAEQDQEEAMNYWEKYLSGYDSLATIPGKINLPVSETPSYRLESKALILQKERMQLLHNVSSKYGITINTLVQAAWGILLSKYNNTEDVVFGAVVSGRPSEIEDVESMVGLFINTVPVRVSIRPEETIASLFQNIQEKAMESDPYHYSLLSEVQALSELGRGLLDHLMIFENYPLTEEIKDDSEINPDNQDFSVANVEVFEQTNYDLSIVVMPGEELKIKMDYNANRFDPKTIQRVQNYLDRIIDQIISNCEVLVSDIEMTTKVERSEILNIFNDTRRDLPKEGTFSSLFAKQAKKTPSNMAVEHNGIKLTYDDLYEKAGRLSTCLQADGLGKNEKVAIYMPRSIDMLCSILAVFHAGGAYVPIDINYPVDRAKEILLNSEAEIILTHRELASQIEALRIPSLKKILTVDHNSLDSFQISEPATGQSDDLAYMIYTSGTTGKPKGVMIHQLGMINHLYAKINDLGIDSKDIIAQSASPSFDISVWQFLSALLAGGKTYIIDNDTVLEPQNLLAELEHGAVTIFESVPSLITTFLDALPAKGKYSLSHLRWMIPTGEALSAALVKKWYFHFPDIKLLNAYGPTEASDDVTHYVVESSEEEQQIIPIGKPVQNTHIYILDKHLNICPVGLRGEICVAGLGVGKGYWKDQDKTLKAFVPNPFVNGNSGNGYHMLYKTGDIGYYQEDGNIICLGRLDEQVKIRGNRVELGEIENVLTGIEQIEEVAVVVKQEGAGKYLAAYYVSQEELKVDVIRSQLALKLLDYMMPSYFVRLDSLPLTSNGKLDRKALPNPENGPTREYVGPETPEEQMLAEVWSEVLGAKNIGVTDNFFAVGGDSIKSIQIGSKMRNLGYEATVRDILVSATIRQLALRMKKILSLSDQATIEGMATLSPIQNWFFSGPLLEKHHYNQSVLLNFPEGLARTELEQVFEKLYAHHDALRMVIKREGNEWFQMNMGKDFPLWIKEKDLRKTQEAASLLASESDKIQASIDLTAGPLMKLGLFHLNDGSRLLVVIHHLVIDGVSWRVLFEDMESLLQQLKNQEPLSLPPKTDPFLSWSSKLEEYTHTNTFQKARKYWEGFQAHKVIPIQRDYLIEENSRKDSGISLFRLSRQETTRLLTKAHSSFHTQINDLLLTALLLSIKNQYGLTAIITDIEVHGREPILTGINVGRTVGWFTSICPVLLECQDKDLSRVIKQVKESLRKVPNNGIDYLLYKNMEIEKVPNERRSKISFNYLGQFDTDTEGMSFIVTEEPHGQAYSQDDLLEYDWEIDGMVKGGRLEMTLTYGTKQYKKETIDSLMEAYKQSLEEIIEHCCSYGQEELTPSDMTYKALSLSQLEELQRKLTK